MQRFLALLFETGELEVSRKASTADDISDDEFSVTQLLSDAEAIWRNNLPLEPPAFDVSSALAAARVVFVASQAVVYRETEVKETRRCIEESGLMSRDAANDAARHYSVDFILRFLPQVMERAARVTESDPLLEVLHQVIEPWPLSSVGVRNKSMDDRSAAALPPALLHPSLWRMYIDRIIALHDFSRLVNPQVRAAVESAIGLYDFLASEMAAHLKNAEDHLTVNDGGHHG